MQGNKWAKAIFEGILLEGGERKHGCSIQEIAGGRPRPLYGLSNELGRDEKLPGEQAW